MENNTNHGNNLSIIKDDTKRSRKSTAVKLPPELTESMIPKYVVYYRECYNREKLLFREYFKIERHPMVKTKRLYISSKSTKIHILDKLQQIKTILYNIENPQESPEENSHENSEENVDKSKKITLPKYVSMRKHEKDNEKYYLIYDKKIGTRRETYKTICSYKQDISQTIREFLIKVDEKNKIENPE
jgi:hypothetical protein